MKAILRRIVRIAALAVLAFLAARGVAETSELWGQHGEQWKETARLPDFSFAGYRCGEKPLPQLPNVVDVRKFGATGDGTTDDTAAFVAALKAAANGAVYVPEGRYVLTRELTLDKSRLVLRGAGPGKTILVLPQSLEQIHGVHKTDGVKSSYAFSGGFVTLRGASKNTRLPALAREAKRGERELVFQQPPELKAGDLLRLTLGNQKDLGREIEANQLDVGKDTFNHKNFVDWVAPVAAVQGTTVTLARPLRLDVHLDWQPELYAWQPLVEDMGVEDLTFQFPGVPKKPHLQEEGFNAIQMHGCINSWVRNIEIIDADNGVICGGGRWCRIEKVTFKAARRKNPSGHHALWATGGSQDCLFQDFQLETQYVHDLSVEGFSSGNVFARGRGQALNFDHHRNGPYENLFTDLEAGDAHRLWDSSGRGDRGPHAGARETFWNIRYQRGKPPAVPAEFPEINVIGIRGYSNGGAGPKEKAWVEAAHDPVEPPNLYEAQLQNRLHQAPATQP